MRHVQPIPELHRLRGEQLRNSIIHDIVNDVKFYLNIEHKQIVKKNFNFTLNRFAQVIAFSLSLDNLLINFACRDIVVSRKSHIHKPFIIAQIQINFATIIQNEDFTFTAKRKGIKRSLVMWVSIRQKIIDDLWTLFLSLRIRNFFPLHTRT